MANILWVNYLFQECLRYNTKKIQGLNEVNGQVWVLEEELEGLIRIIYKQGRHPKPSRLHSWVLHSWEKGPTDGTAGFTIGFLSSWGINKKGSTDGT